MQLGGDAERIAARGRDGRAAARRRAARASDRGRRLIGAASAIAYPTLLAGHLVAVALFVAGLLVAAALLPGLAARADRGAAWRLEVRRLRAIGRFATTPALLLVWAFGIAMAAEAGWYASGWLRAKVVLVIALSAWHGRQMRVLRRLAGGGAAPRISAGVPIVLVATVCAIVALAVAKPF